MSLQVTSDHMEPVWCVYVFLFSVKRDISCNKKILKGYTNCVFNNFAQTRSPFFS